MLADFFEDFPTPQHLERADVDELAERLKPLGLQTQRAEQLVGMSRHYLDWEVDKFPGERPPAKVVRLWPGCGRYAEESYRMVALGERDFEPHDKELYRLWEYSTKSS